MTLSTRASIAQAVVGLVGSLPGDGAEGMLAAGVLARAPGDGAPAICRTVAAAIGMEVLDIRMPQIEYHTGAMSHAIGVPFEQAVATGREVLVVLDEAQSAEAGVLEAAMAIIAARIEDRPCAILAITTTHGERRVAERMAEGLGRDVGRIAMHRTDVENARLAEHVAAAN